ncbi:hypothetical protein [Nocardia wallacei]|uniref:hypothetical protein n=1 Tax=Nocardia wallacei TaxID=480035 RepID=UPI002458E967|nr:hypothetical protein [Nocardia wallacei]
MSTPEWMLTNPDAGVDERPDYGRADVAEAAVQRLLDFAGYWDSGVVAVTDGHTLHVRDIEGIALLVRDALLRIPADGMSLEYVVQWTDVHGDARTDSATSRETAYYMAEALRAVQARQHRLPDACVKVRAVGPLMDDTPPET